ncbi:uncharacterized protein SEPMUDRAFT_86165 [Sphaerulina musiva SO2202]|uniref:Uncharacterized protein n=1 Tax=Sphaerulina musiva (strain SO2202) TaxID=692275 RepID=M3CG97_SPHMS|nr:uncharacterized protein SEPMUDRAFT_86165 [Sphaerulina musiva SO2202]EMF12823.1 hypothetical protein SEPMUDRAFT_86165 [Sphaerulina musiva SO2202]
MPLFRKRGSLRSVAGRVLSRRTYWQYTISAVTSSMRSLVTKDLRTIGRSLIERLGLEVYVYQRAAIISQIVVIRRRTIDS